MKACKLQRHHSQHSRTINKIWAGGKGVVILLNSQPAELTLDWLYEQKFKDLSNTCQISSDRRVLDLEPDVLGSILTGGNILSLEYFVFADANIGIIANITYMFMENSSGLLLSWS